MSAVVVADFDDEDRGAKHGKSLVDDAVAAGATWVTISSHDDCRGLRATWRAARDASVGVIVRLDDTKALAYLDEALGNSGELSVAALRDKLLVLVSNERAGKRVRTDAQWAPSAVDLGMFTGFLSFLRRAAPNHLRAAALADDVVMPHDHLPPERIAALTEKLSLRGGRLWLSEVPPDLAASLRALPVDGLLVRFSRS